jgi:hypothetical protein
MKSTCTGSSASSYCLNIIHPEIAYGELVFLSDIILNLHSEVSFCFLVINVMATKQSTSASPIIHFISHLHRFIRARSAFISQ